MGSYGDMKSVAIPDREEVIIPSLDSLARLAQELGVSTDYLITDKQHPAQL